LLDARFEHTPFARGAGGVPPPAGALRCASLGARGLVDGSTLPAQAQAAYRHLQAAGWTDAALESAATTTAFDVWRAVAAGYASAYLRRDAAHMPCGFRYAATGADGQPGEATPAVRASWWSDASGIPPGNGVGVYGGADSSADPTLDGLQCLRTLWTADGTEAQALRASVAATAARMPRADLPLWIVHGASDGLVPVAFSSAPYVAWLRDAGRRPLYWQIPHAQHFDAFLALPGFGARHVPLLPYGYAALDRLWAHLRGGAAWPATVPTPAPQPRGSGPMTAQALDLP
jgi:hydroxybutyrate-dimer hydrolase